MADKQVTIPDIGTPNAVTIIDIAIKPGDEIKTEDTLLTLESDKATMDVPAPFAGKVKSVAVKVGDKVKQNDLILTLEVNEDSAAAAVKSEPTEKTNKQTAAASAASTVKAEAAKPSVVEVVVPDIGNVTKVAVIEILVKKGDQVDKDGSLITLESDKATMEVPSPYAGTVEDILIKVGDQVKQGDLILHLKTTAVAEPKAAPQQTEQAQKKAVATQQTSVATTPKPVPTTNTREYEAALVHASPAVRRLAREFGVNLALVTGSGRKQRIVKEDVQAYVKSVLTQVSHGGGFGSSLNLAPAPEVDFSQFGEIEIKPLSRINKIAGAFLHRSWVTIPHVTQFEEADITEMELFRQENKEAAEKAGFKLTPLVFIMKAVVACLKHMPRFNTSLDAGGENLIYKKYFHLGVAVDTPDGLVVPVIQHVDQKSLFELAKELQIISEKARKKQLKPMDMQGGCFTISSLGGIGGTAFTPIINAPDVAILGVSKAAMKMIYKHEEFVPRLMLPLSLSYDHRVIDGADGARFITALSQYLADIRKWLL